MSVNPVPSLWRHRSFAAFWWSRMFSIIAFQIQAVAIGWQVYALTRDPWDLGMVGLAQFLPILLLTLPGGHVADHHDRRRIMMLGQAAYAGLLAVLAVGSGQHWLDRNGLLVLAFLIGAVRAFEFPAASAMLPSLVPSAQLVPALSLTGSARQAAFIAGPALGGGLYALGAEVTYAVAAGLFLLALAAAALIRPSTPVRPREPVTWATVLAGITYIRGNRVLLGAISLDLFAVLLGGATALLPVYAREILMTGPLGLGLLRAAPAVGALLMSFVLARWPVERHTGRIMFASVALFGAATMVFAVSTVMWLSLASLLVLGAADMVSVVVRSALVQLETPEDMRGRVGAVNWLFIGTSNQLGEFESGVTASWFGASRAVLLGGAGTLLVCALWMRWFPQLLRRDRMGEP
ncbi:transmembrane secretion effector [Fluviicoccus keumensis]|uniref:Transmembrane secretion effector n=1 Tax=Fluviicoccus keumensis TaxID=1435465 RepID=A0A4Q7YID9_9GAMM|nr:MFS transporter [Fluviicoccus keumensis]RZU36888.1 transmembrane secretion effector [Fluviicoccus keumensis]